jgi:hypothetical protein
MCEINCRIAAVVLLISTGNTFAFTASLSVGGNGLIVDVPLSGLNDGSLPGAGGTFDVRVNFVRNAGDTDFISSAQTDFVADATGITIRGTFGSTTLSGTGTRYNQLEWDANTNGSAQNPNTTLFGAMAAGVPRGTMGTLYNGSWTVGDSFFGILNVTLAPRPYGTLINLDPFHTIIADFDDIFPVADGMTFHYVPEPASILFLLPGCLLLRRRRITA